MSDHSGSLALMVSWGLGKGATQSIAAWAAAWFAVRQHADGGHMGSESAEP